MSFRRPPLTRHRSRRRPRLAVAAAAGLGLVAARDAVADTYTWTATNGGNWSTGFDAGAPVSDPTNQLVFTPGNYNAYDDIGDFSSLFNLNSITVNADGASNVALGVNSAGGGAGASTVNFSGGSGSGLFVNAGSVNYTLASNFGSGSQIVNAGAGNLTITAPIDFAHNGTTTITNGVAGTASTGTLIINDATTGSAAGVVLTGVNSTINVANYNPVAGSMQIGDMAGVSGTLNITNGYVKAANTGGDLFGEALILNVASGATFDFNSNAEGMGGLTGAGNVVLTTSGTLTANLTFDAPGDRTFSGSISGTGAITQNVRATLTYGAGASNTYSGNTTVNNGGTLRAGGANVMSPNSVVVVNYGNLDLGGFSQTVAGLQGGSLSGSLALGSSTLTINPAAGANWTFGVGLTGNGNVVVSGAATGTQTLSGSNTYTGTTLVNSGTLRLNIGGLVPAGGTATVASGATLDVIVPSNMSAGSTYLNGSGNFAKEGAGTLTFSQANAGFTPSKLIVLGGTLTLDQTTDLSAKVPQGTPLTLGNGTLSLIGNGSTAYTQTFGGLSVGGTGTTGGSGTFAVTASGGQAATIALGNITRSFGGAVDFPALGTGASITTTASLANNILGGWATYNNGSGFATVTGGVIAPLATYNTSLASTASTSTSNVTVATGSTISSNTSANSLRITAAATFAFANTGNPSSATSTLTLTSGGILLPSTNSGAVVLGSTGAATRGVVTTPSGTDLVVDDFGTGLFTLNSVIAGDSGLSKNGPGTMVISAVNTYAGTTYINGGTLVISGTAAATSLGASGNPIVFNGGTLQFSSGSIGSVTNYAHPITVGPGGATFNFGSSQTIDGMGLTGTGQIIKTGAGQLSVGSNASSYTGNIIVNAGILRETSSQLGKASGLTLANGAQFMINDDATANFGIAPGAPVVFGGGVGPSGSANPGAFVLTDQSPTGAAGISPDTTFSNPFTFLADTTIGVYNGSSTRMARLTFPNPITGTGNLIKAGNGTLVLASSNNAFGNDGGTVIVGAGILVDGANNAIPAAATLQLGQTGATTPAIFDLGGFTQTVAGFSTAGSGAPIVVNSNTSTGSTLTVNYTGSTPQTFAGQIGLGTTSAPSSAALSLVKTGSGTLTLSGTNTFTGSATVAAGALRIQGITDAARAYAVTTGGNLILTNTDPTAGPLPATALSLGADGSNSNLTFEFSGASAPTSGMMAVSTAGGLTTGGTVNVTIGSAQPLSVGTTPLIYYSGSIGGAGFAALQAGTLNLPSRAIGTLVNDTTNDVIDLNITGVDFIKYTGAVNGNWDIATTNNFKLNSTNAATDYIDQPSPDSVVFDDTAPGTKTVNLTTTLSPAAVTVNGAADYTFGGTGSLAGTTGLTKNDGATLTVLTSNTYTGATTVNGGTLVFGNGGTTGTMGTGNAAVNGATLAFNRSDAVAVNSNITGTGTIANLGAGTTTLNGTNSVGSINVAAGTVAIAGVTTLSGDTAGPGPITIPGGTLTLSPTSGTSTIANAVSGTGNINVNASAVNFTASAGLNMSAGSLNVLAATSNVSSTGPMTLTGVSVGANTLNLTSDSAMAINGTISGTGTLTKAGAGTLTMIGSSNGFTGTFIVNAGTAVLNDPTTTQGDLGAASIVVNNTGTFVFGPTGNPDLPANTIVTVNSGGVFKLQIGEDYGGIVLNGGTYIGGNGNTAANSTAGTGFTFYSGTVASSGTGASSLSGAVTLDKYSDGTVNFNGSTGINAAVTINVHQGTLAFTAASFPTGTTAPLYMGDGGTVGTVQLTDAKTATTTRSIILQGNGGALGVLNAAGVLNVAGSVGGSSPLAINGAGTVNFTVPNTYAADTTVTGATLRANATGSAGSGTVYVATGGTLGGNGSVGAVTVNAGGTVTAGASATATGVLTTGTLSLADGSAFTVKTDGATADELLVSSLSVPNPGTVTLNLTATNTSAGASVAPGTTFVIAVDSETTNNPLANGVPAALALAVNNAVGVTGGGYFTLATTPDSTSGYDLLLDSVSAAPEPTSLLLLGLAAGPLTLGRRRRARAR